MQILPNWHPIFVHFTVALFSLATLLFILPLLFKGARWAEQCRTVAMWNLWIGSGLSLLTVGSGWYAFNTVNHDDPSHLVMLEHRQLAIITFVLFLFLAGLSYYKSRQGQTTGWAFAIGMVIAAGMLGSTAWHGGELVYRHGLGVMSLPSQDKHSHANGGHSHDHADSPSNSSSDHDATHSHDDEHDHAHDSSSEHEHMEADHHDEAPAAMTPQSANESEEGSKEAHTHVHADGTTHTHNE